MWQIYVLGNIMDKDVEIKSREDIRYRVYFKQNIEKLGGWCDKNKIICMI